MKFNLNTSDRLLDIISTIFFSVVLVSLGSLLDILFTTNRIILLQEKRHSCVSDTIGNNGYCCDKSN